MLVADDRSAHEMVELVHQRNLAYAGIDSEFTSTRPAVAMKRLGGKSLEWFDPKSVVPLLVSLAFVEHDAGRNRIYRFVVDVRNKCVLPSLQAVLDVPIPFSCHFGGAELTCLWQLGLHEPRTVWDSWVAAHAQVLGHYHSRYQAKDAEDEVEAEGASEAQSAISNHCDLLSVCSRHGFEHPFANRKEQMQRSFLAHAPDQTFTTDQLEYAVADAVASAHLYMPQVLEALRTNTLNHLQQVEMPWMGTNARMHYDGVHVCPRRLKKVFDASMKHVDRWETSLREQGLDNVNSHSQVNCFFASKGLLTHFQTRDGYSFSDSRLEAVEHLHPAIAEIRALGVIRGCSQISCSRTSSSEQTVVFTQSTGNWTPESTRNSMRWPNIGGIGKALRPLVVPQDPLTTRIGEVDLSQIEVGIAAALYQDPKLIEMFNTGDVYSRMAKQFYRDRLPPEAMGMPDKKFKKVYKEQRSSMKVFTLGIIYNITAMGLAAQLRISVAAAQQQLNGFLAMFPELARALEQAVRYGAIRGRPTWSPACDGIGGRAAGLPHGRAIGSAIRRSRAPPVSSSRWRAIGCTSTTSTMAHGSCCPCMMPLFSSATARLQEVATITADVMRNAAAEMFPVLNPQVDINIDHPHCWNKDGKYRSLDYWCLSPEAAKQYMNS